MFRGLLSWIYGAPREAPAPAFHVDGEEAGLSLSSLWEKVNNDLLPIFRLVSTMRAFKGKWVCCDSFPTELTCDYPVESNWDKRHFIYISDVWEIDGQVHASVWSRDMAVDTRSHPHPWRYAPCTRHGSADTMFLPSTTFRRFWVYRPDLVFSKYTIKQMHIVGARDRLPRNAEDVLNLEEAERYMEERGPPPFWRVLGDWPLYFGDGGEAGMMFPIWVHPNLSVDVDVRKRLLASFLSLNEQQKDKQHESPVEDIVDPDLCPMKLSDKFDMQSWVDRRCQQVVDSGRAAPSNLPLPHGVRRWDEPEHIVADIDPNDERDKTMIPLFRRSVLRGRYNVSENIKLRSTYQWIPSQFMVYPDGHVEIDTPIHNLADVDGLYGDVAEVFAAMIPMWQAVGVIPDNMLEPRSLQVVVKVQCYCIAPGTKYAGRWHTEGLTENIVAAGVYYLHIDDGLEGGAVKFRAAETPDISYVSLVAEAKVEAGTALVFSNEIPHRVRAIRNPTDKPLRRMFMNFFVIDPSRPIEISTATHVTADFIRKVISRFGRHSLGGKHIPRFVVDHILSYTSIWTSKSKARTFRRACRDAMAQDISGWGYSHWGNAGTVTYIPSYSKADPICKHYGDDTTADNLRHTESE
eukprot:TRINITY_DN5528_c0_g1_i1.p1 TRINITY_DN5528_c0_g1~~TRINITY_DN5528_c0_g1_i1.p1  ORF type:complete len:633 (+),score=92.22 TRINITY_DN5528_c0_g1_i1:211-2109(+)